jgi:cation diffusion facilitator family transporter
MNVGTTRPRDEGIGALVQSSIAPRHSAATRRGGAAAGHLRSIMVALAANVVVAVAKLTAGLISGSSALLAEAVHSAADSINEVLLWVSMRRGVRPADAEHPLGYGGARFLWAFLAAISSFVIGGCVSIGLAIHSLMGGGHVDHFLIAWIVLSVAAVADGASLVQTVRQARREAAQWNTSTLRYLRGTSDPTLRALAVEDAAALMGVMIAALGLLVHELAGPSSGDAIASLLIGILLAITAVGLARPLADLLIGRSLAPARLQKAWGIIEHSPAIDHVLNLYAVHAAPHEAILTARVHPTAGQSGDQLAQHLDELDQRLRRELPEIGEVFIDITAHLRPATMEAA